MALSPIAPGLWVRSYRPSKLDALAPPHRNLLIQAAARSRYAKLYRIAIAKQRTLESQWQSTQAAIAQLYPHVDFASLQLQQELSARAEAWWRVKGVKGAGVDW